MPPVRAIRNQYLGINAHLNSRLQTSGDWPGFHTSHIDDFMRLLRVPLFPMGYTADLEKSLQIRRYGEPRYNPEADVLIFDNDPSGRLKPAPVPVSGGAALVYPAADLLDYAEIDVRYHKAVAIYSSSGQERGEPVVWIELLSPSNKPGGQDSGYYEEKRRAIIEAGIVFVEIDYLHEQPATFRRLPTYRPQKPARSADEGISPYRIVVIDPRPDIESGYGRVYPFRVDEPMPLVDIPLSGDDVLHFNFGPAYNKTFEEVLYGAEIDYRQLPVHFERYREADQARIVSRMLAVLDAAQAGRDLEQPPQPVETLPLDEALKRLEAYSEA